MLEEGCLLDIVDCAGATLLHFAAAGGNLEFVHELLGRGCNVNVTKANGYTPLLYATDCDRTEEVLEL